MTFIQALLDTFLGLGAIILGFIMYFGFIVSVWAVVGFLEIKWQTRILALVFIILDITSLWWFINNH